MAVSIISHALLCPKFFPYKLRAYMASGDERNGQHLHSTSEQTPSQHLAQGTITAPMGYWHLHSTSTHVFRSAPSQHRPVCFTLAPSQHQGVCFNEKNWEPLHRTRHMSSVDSFRCFEQFCKGEGVVCDIIWAVYVWVCLWGTLSLATGVLITAQTFQWFGFYQHFLSICFVYVTSFSLCLSDICANLMVHCIYNIHT